MLVLTMAAVVLLSACAQRIGSSVSDPVTFMGAKTRLIARDMVQVTASVAHPVAGAATAYADCVAAQYALIRGMSHASRVTSTTTGQADIVSEKTTYLVSSVAPDGKNVLNAQEIVTRCKANNVPTV